MAKKIQRRPGKAPPGAKSRARANARKKVRVPKRGSADSEREKAKRAVKRRP